jgi:hypothetical protein
MLGPMLIAVAVLSCKPPRVEYVPAPCPPPPVIAKPQLPIAAYQPTWTQQQKEKALWESLALAVGYSQALEEALKAYRQQPAPEPKKVK